VYIVTCINVLRLSITKNSVTIHKRNYICVFFNATHCLVFVFQVLSHVKKVYVLNDLSQFSPLFNTPYAARRSLLEVCHVFLFYLLSLNKIVRLIEANSQQRMYILIHDEFEFEYTQTG